MRGARSKVVIAIRNVAVTSLSGLFLVSAHAAPVNFFYGLQGRDVRQVNSTRFTPGDRHLLDSQVDNPVGTTVVATNVDYVDANGTPRPVELSSTFDIPSEFARTEPFGQELPLTPWTFTATNGQNSVQIVTANDLSNVEPLPFVRNFRIAPDNLTPTLIWDLPVGNTVPFDVVQVGYFNDVTDERLRFENNNIFTTLPANETSFKFPAGLLEDGVPYVFRVILTDLENGERINRSLSFKNFTPIDGSGGPEVFLPTVDANGVFIFDFDINGTEPVIIDPFVAIGYTYEIGAGDPNFRSVTLPNIGDGKYDLTLPGGVVVPLQAGEEYVFSDLGVNTFTVTGIETSAELDPTDVTAFMTELTFLAAGPSSFTGTMTPITELVDSVPEPATVALFSLGLAGLRVACRRKKP